MKAKKPAKGPMPLGWGGGYGTCDGCGKYERVTFTWAGPPEARDIVARRCWKCS